MSAKLKFEANRLITGINIIDGMLFFTDDKTEPKKINIEAFKNADHSTGTTSIYGRKFQERDITVIRPAPVAALKTGLSTIDPDFNSGDGITPYAESIDILTNDAVVISQTEVELYGYAESAQANITNLGFYYIAAESTSDIDNLLLAMAEGTKVTADSANAGNFNHRLTGLTANTRYYFVAFGFNSIGQEIIADNVLTFRTESATVNKVAPTVSTLDPIRISPGKYRLKGQVSDLGGESITQASFYFIRYDILSNLAKPATLVGTPGAIRVDASYDAASGEYYYIFNAGDLFYVEFYAKNTIGDDAGGVKGGLGVTGNSTLLAPEVNYITRTIDTDGLVSVQVTAKVVNQHGRISERGFYLSKYNSNLSSDNYQHSISDRIYKISVPFDATNVMSNYTLDTASVTGLNLYPGDTLYVLPYAYNGIQGIGVQVPIGIQNNSVPVVEPHVITEQPTSILDGNDIILKIGVEVVSNGYNSETSGLTDNDGVVNLGCIVYKGDFNEFGNLTQEQKEVKMLELLNSNKADKIIFQKPGALSQVFDVPDVNIVATGLHVQNFEGTPIAPIDEGYEYYTLGFATNVEKTGYGRVLSTKVQVQDTLIPTISTTKVTNNNSTYAKTFHGAVIDFDLGQGDIYDAGFTVASGSARDFNLNVGTKYSLRVLNGGTVKESSSIATINNFINNTGTKNPGFSIEVPNLYTAFLPAGNNINVQAWVQMEANGPYYGASHEGEGNVKQDGILSFNNSEPPQAEEAPTVQLVLAEGQGATKAIVSGRISHDNMTYNEALKYGQSNPAATQTGIFYAKTNTIPSSVSAAQKAQWLRENGTVVYPYYSPNLEFPPPPALNERSFSYNFGTSVTLNTVNNDVLTFNALEPDSAYSVVAWVGNSVGYNSSAVEGLTTTPATSIYVEAYFPVSAIRANQATVGYEIKGYGDTHMIYGRLYYVKKTDISANPTSAEISADADSAFEANENSIGTVGQRPKYTNIIYNLEPGTEYWAMWEMNFTQHGIKRSDPVSFKTTGGLPTQPDSTIRTDTMALEFDGYGNLRDEHVLQLEDKPDNSILVEMTPNTSDFDIIKGSGNWSSMSYTKKTAFGQKYAIFKPTYLAAGSSTRTWSCSIFNKLNPTETILLSFRQLPASSYYDNPEDGDNFPWDGYGQGDGLGVGDGSGGDSSGGGGGGSGPSENDFGDEGLGDNELSDGDGLGNWGKNPFNLWL